MIDWLIDRTNALNSGTPLLKAKIWPIIILHDNLETVRDMTKIIIIR